MSKVKVIIDTDPGVDDAMAILYAILEQRIELIGLTSIFGNVNIDTATRNALRLTELAGVSIPVAKGAQKPLVQPLRQPATYVHGEEGFGNIPAAEPVGRAVEEPAHEFICGMINKYPGEVVLCPIGPLTNIALALDHDPSIAQKVKSVTIMGGSVNAGGNVTPYAEANIWQDPHAAEKVFTAGWQVNMIGLDVTHQIIFNRDDFVNLAQSAPVLGSFLRDAAGFYMDFHLTVEENPIDGCYMHDPAAVIFLVNPEIFSIDEMPLDVILEGEKVGQTIAHNSNSRHSCVNVAVRVDTQAVRKCFFEGIGVGF